MRYAAFKMMIGLMLDEDRVCTAATADDSHIPVVIFHLEVIDERCIMYSYRPPPTRWRLQLPTIRLMGFILSSCNG